MTDPIEEALLAVMTEAHTLAIKDDTPYPKIRLHDLARIIGGDYHARLSKMKAEAVARERERCIECAAKVVYDGFIYTEKGKKPEWQEGGNSLVQDQARMIAREALTPPTDV